MTMRRTPYEKIRYPWTSDVAAATDLQAMAADIDQSLVQTASLAANFAKFSSVTAQRTTTLSINKATLTTLTFTGVLLDNGTDSPLAGGAWWDAAAPTRLTAPVPCVVLASAFAGMNFTAVQGTSGSMEVAVSVNGGTAAPNIQGTRYAIISGATGQHWASALTMWKLNKGDYLELRIWWTGSGAGPYNSDNVLPPQLSIMQVALPTVP
jgi:hypothetical protein